MKKKYSVEEVKTDLEIDEHLELHEKGWKLQRLGWILIFMMVLMAAFGVFGDGLLSKSRLQGSQATVEYERFYRFEARMKIKADLTAAGPQSYIAFPNSYLEKFKIESILPEPSGNKIEGDQTIYFFEGSQHMNIIFYLVPQAVGNISGTIDINQNQFSLNHFIYP